jgi:hydrolase, P-loop family
MVLGERYLSTEQDTTFLARGFAEALSRLDQSRLLIFLEGELGTGKSFFVRAFLRALGCSGTIKSPTYSYLESYDTHKGTVNHFDLYRFSQALQWYEFGFDEVIATSDINLIEWPQQIASLKLAQDLSFHFRYKNEGRSVLIASYSKKGEELRKAQYEKNKAQTDLADNCRSFFIKPYSCE